MNKATPEGELSNMKISYEIGAESKSQIARNYKVTPQAMHKFSLKYGWIFQSKAKDLSEEVQSRVITELADDSLKHTKGYVENVEKIATYINETLEVAKTADDKGLKNAETKLKIFKMGADIYKDQYAMTRKIFGMDLKQEQDAAKNSDSQATCAKIEALALKAKEQRKNKGNLKIAQ